MWSISQTTAFEAAHRLMRNLSKCSNIHGHNYKIETIISYYELDKKDMIIDFYVVKNILDNIIENFDHAILLNQEDTYWINIMKANSMKLYIMDSEPTAECIALLFAKTIHYKLPLSAISTKVTVYETDNCKASYEHRPQKI